MSLFSYFSAHIHPAIKENFLLKSFRIPLPLKIVISQILLISDHLRSVKNLTRQAIKKMQFC
jgi:hypothetical protein